jgi:hypothetical protein
MHQIIKHWSLLAVIISPTLTGLFALNEMVLADAEGPYIHSQVLEHLEASGYRAGLAPCLVNNSIGNGHAAGSDPIGRALLFRNMSGPGVY